MPSARKLFDERVVYGDGSRVALRLWHLPAPLPPSKHRFKYALYYGRPGELLVLIDNERGKGDHMHLRGIERPYCFISPERLVEDFWAAVSSARMEEERG